MHHPLPIVALLAVLFHVPAPVRPRLPAAFDAPPPPCVACSAILENPDACTPPSPALLCKGPSADAWHSLDVCMCASGGACAAVCDGLCPGGTLDAGLYVCPASTPNAAACMSCVEDTEAGCGIEAQICAFDG